MKWITNPTLFVKLILAFLLMLVPLFSLFLWMNDKSMHIIQNEVSDSISDRVHFYNSMLEKEMNRIIVMQRDFLNDEELLYLSVFSNHMSDYERKTSIVNLQRKLEVFKNSSDYILEPRIYIPSLDRIITSSQYITGIDGREFKAMLINNQTTHTPFIYWSHRLFISLQNSNGSITNPDFVLTVEISKKELMDVLNHVLNQLNGNIFWIEETKRWSIGELPGGNGSKGAVSDWLASFHDAPVQTEAPDQIGHYLVISEYSGLLGTRLNAFIPKDEILGPLYKYKQWILILTFVSVAIIVLFSLWIYQYVHKPLRTVMKAIRRVEDGNLQVVIRPVRKDEFGYLHDAFNRMVERLNYMIQQIYEQKIRTQHAELKRLESQIAPHFLYNSFFVLARLMKMHNFETAYRFVKYLGDYYRFITRDAQENVTVEQEVLHAMSYLKIQEICYSERIQIEVGELPEGIKHCQIPRLTIQPLIENAFKHVFEVKAAAGRLSMRWVVRDEDIWLTIEDNGDILTTEKVEELRKKLRPTDFGPEEMTGLMNVHRRLQLQFGSDYGLSLAISDTGGLRVEARLRKIEVGA